jgi:hypothetical protein
MTAQGESYPHHFFAKRWHPAFAERRNFKETVSYVESMRRIGATGDNFDRFWKHDPDLQDAVPFSKILDVKNFCHGVSPEDLEPNISPADFKRSGWLEDRSLSCGSSRKNCRQYKNWPSYRKRLTAAELYHSLKLEVKDKPLTLCFQRTVKAN